LPATGNLNEVGQDWAERPPRRPNTTALYGDRRVTVLRFRGPRALRPGAHPDQIRATIDAREALVSIEGEERWVPIGELADLAAEE
jgi:hypothetical protein